ncbi:membrane protein [Clostridium botulinum]|uniref:Membrane protein n=3 Tax=Clostridium botulinum TaxID=1491 RepID=A0A9Q1UZ05_CLOBO|nr:membrane protein, putative [Clostridium botulinum BKT015925]KEI03527.1 membrane protein [Clostridium botulinum C/D str. Sp77]KOA73772.1 membrane protein [Clostridium botulinum]MCD3197301.1 FUSC family protein [Clostridium botulinum C/D]KOA83961.1 membrane protein [Clostridium botulinum]
MSGDRMNKKLIISKTILFVLIVSFIIAFQKIFGIENTLIGVTVITATLMLLEEDLTVSPFKYFIYFMGINLLLGVLAFVASLNLWLGIVVNFIAMFIIGFLFCYDLKSNLYIPFGLQYLFMLSMPVLKNQFVGRLISLVFGAAFIVVIQLIFNKHRLTKASNKIVESILEKIINKLQLISDKNLDTDIDSEIEKEIKQIKKLIYSKKKDGFYLTESGRINLGIVSLLESINLSINDLRNDYKENSLQEILQYLNNKIKILYEYKKNVEKLNIIKKEVKENLSYKSYNNLSEKKILINLDILCDYFVQLYNLENQNYIDKTNPVPSEFNVMNVLKRNFTANSLKFSYAFRLAICVSISIFIMDYFKIHEARWMAYTVFSIVQPYSEHSKIKSLQRLKGTLIGGIIFIVLFSIFKDPIIRSVIVIGAGYIDGYNTTYDKKMICVTISALGTAAVTASIGSILGYRILFVLLGLVVALMANKFILPYTLKDSTEDLMYMSDYIMDKLIEESKMYISKRNNKYTIENLFIIFSLIEDKLNLNKFYKHIKDYEQHLKNKKKVITNIYEIYIWAENDKILSSKFKEMLTKISNNEMNYWGNTSINKS